MNTRDFETPEQLAQYVEAAFEEQNLDEAKQSVADVESVFADSFIAHHVAGIVWERSYLEEAAMGQEPPLEYYDKAEAHYRRAMELEAEGEDQMTRERLFRCLFILGSQRADVPRLEEAVKLAQELELNAETEDFAEDIRRDRAVVLVMLAKELDRRERYEEAALFLEKLGPPKNDEAAQFFHHYYEGMVNRGLGQLDEDEARIRKAISSFYRALAIDETNPKVIYMVADCLVQLEEPSTGEVAEMDELVQALQAADVLGSGLMDPLRKRWELRHQMLEEQ